MKKSIKVVLSVFRGLLVVTRFRVLHLGRFLVRVAAAPIAVDDLDVLMLRYILERHGGTVTLDELKVAVTLGALAPKWRELLSLPAVQSLIPMELMSAISTNLAERELVTRVEKLVSLGLLRKVRDGDKEKVKLTELGRAVGEMGALTPEVLERYTETNEDLLPRNITSMVLRPSDRVLVESREDVFLETCPAVLLPSRRVALSGLNLIPMVLERGFKGRVKIVIVGGHLPVLLRLGDELGFLVSLCDEW